MRDVIERLREAVLGERLLVGMTDQLWDARNATDAAIDAVEAALADQRAANAELVEMTGRLSRHRDDLAEALTSAPYESDYNHALQDVDRLRAERDALRAFAEWAADGEKHGAWSHYIQRRAQLALDAAQPPDASSGYLDVVFDGPPGPEAGRFIEVENEHGYSVRVGEWIERTNGHWALRLPWAGGASQPPDAPCAPSQAPREDAHTPTCAECGGRGRVSGSTDDGMTFRDYRCPACHGTGRRDGDA